MTTEFPGLIPDRHWPFQIQLSLEAVLEHNEHGAADSSLAQLASGIRSKAMLEQHTELISAVLQPLFPPQLGRSEIKAACIPFTDIIFNPTDRLKTILSDAGPGYTFSIRDKDAHHSYIACCCLILSKYYHVSLDLRQPLFIEIPGPGGIIKYYRIIYTTDFIKVSPTDAAVPISRENITQLMNNYDDLELWKSFFPEGSWILKGFAIMSLFDVTIENAASVFKERLLALRTNNFKENITAIFRSIFSIPGIEIGFTLFDASTGRLRPALFNGQNLSFLLPGGQDSVAKKIFTSVVHESIILQHKKFVVADTGNCNNDQAALCHIFQQQGMHSFILAPVAKDGHLSGILEVVSRNVSSLHSVNAQKLEIVMPFLADAIERLITRFYLQVEALIQQYFTAIHPSVKWKFSKEAEKFLYYQELGRSYRPGDIVLKNVFPLYGQTDIKGSGRQRNECVRADLARQLTDLESLLKQTSYLENEVPAIQHLLSRLQEFFPADTEEQITRYLDKIGALLLNKNMDQHNPLLAAYLHQSDKMQGDYHQQRRNYDRTIHLINENLSSILHAEQLAAQQIFPHYFEYHKTDGIDHILYAGKSITPHLSLTKNRISALRSWQLKTLCKLYAAHRQLKKSLPFALDVTSLILVYPYPLTLRFRIDEKKLDIDGSYNLSFELLKKRIDKAKVKDSNERITLPGKLTVVFTSADDRQEYENYFRKSGEMLEQQWEILEIEDLQDVAGLKALRVAFK